MELSIRDILNVAFRYSRTLLIFWAVVVGATLVFYFQSRWAYESTAKILISLGPEAQGRAEYLNGKNLQLLQREQQIHDEQQILQSHEVLLTTAKWITGDPVAGSPPPIDDWRLKEAQRYFTGQQPEPTLLLRAVKIATSTLGRFGKPETHAEQLEDMVEEISKALSVNAIFDSDALDVKFRYRDPRVAQTVLRLLIAAYINHHIEVFQTSAESDLVKAQFDQVVGQYHNRLAEFSSFMKTHRVYNDQSQMNALIEEREKLQQGLNNAQADSDAEDARLATLKSIDQSLQRFEQYSTTEVRNKQREELSSKLNNTLLEEQVLLSHHPQGSRAYKEEQLKLDELRRLVAQEPAQVVDQTEQRRSKASELAESEIISATEAQKGDQARFDRLHQDLRNTDSEIAGYVGDLQQFNSLKLELDLAKQESEQMAQVYANSRL